MPPRRLYKRLNVPLAMVPRVVSKIQGWKVSCMCFDMFDDHSNVNQKIWHKQNSVIFVVPKSNYKDLNGSHPAVTFCVLIGFTGLEKLPQCQWWRDVPWCCHGTPRGRSLPFGCGTPFSRGIWRTWTALAPKADWVGHRWTIWEIENRWPTIAIENLS